MKYITYLITAFLLTSFSLFAQQGKIEEAVFIPDIKALEKISEQRLLVVDHPSEFGFELYGPSGMKEWLREQGIYYTSETHSHEKSIQSAKYPSYSEVVENLRSLVALNPKIARLFSIGKSHQGRDLWVVKISDHVEKDEVEPEFKYISSMHGDEITGRELTQSLIKDLIESYGKDKQITNLIDNTEIYIMPSMNPDGSELKQRANAKGFDLNRNFPDWKRGDSNNARHRQLETQAVMKFQAQRKFSLSANFHGGAVVVNYPWDNTYDKHPLDNLLKKFSIGYAQTNPGMRSSRRFPGGITNGATWYKVYGGMQDWSYYWYNDLQVTVELSKKKWPNYRDIPSFYRDNKESMLNYIKYVHQGGGFKFDTAITGSVQISRLSDGESLGKYGFSDGEFYKVLPTGDYQLRILAAGIDITKTISVRADDISTNGNFLAIQTRL